MTERQRMKLDEALKELKALEYLTCAPTEWATAGQNS